MKRSIRNRKRKTKKKGRCSYKKRRRSLGGTIMSQERRRDSVPQTMVGPEIQPSRSNSTSWGAVPDPSDFAYTASDEALDDNPLKKIYSKIKKSIKNKFR